MSHNTAQPGLARRIIDLAWPVLIAQLSSMTQMVSDTVLTGRYGTTDLAAVAVGSGIYISIVMLMVGILQAVAPTVAHHVGAGRKDAIGPAVQQGFWLALGLAIPAVLFLRHPDWLMQLSEISPEVEAGARDYLSTIAWGLPAVLLYRTFYAFTNALGRTRVLMAISLTTTAVHIPLSWALINGYLPGVPALGGTRLCRLECPAWAGSRWCVPVCMCCVRRPTQPTSCSPAGHAPGQGPSANCCASACPWAFPASWRSPPSP
jgi:MATE family multidrug resistance protein